MLLRNLAAQDGGSVAEGAGDGGSVYAEPPRLPAGASAGSAPRRAYVNMLRGVRSLSMHWALEMHWSSTTMTIFICCWRPASGLSEPGPISWLLALASIHAYKKQDCHALPHSYRQ